MIRILVFCFFIFSFFYLTRKGKNFVYYLPIFNLIADMSFSFFSGYSAPTLMRGIILTMFLIYFRRELLSLASFKTLYIFLIYLVFLLFTSNEFSYSLKAVFQVIISMLMLAIGYVYINSFEKFRKLMSPLFWIVVISIVVTASGYLFGIGKVLEYTSDNKYKGTEEFVGFLGSGGLYSAAIVVGILPFLLKYRLHPFERWIYILASLVLYVFILLNVRRTAISIPIAGIFVYMMFSRSKLYSIRMVLVSALILILSFPLYEKVIKPRLALRESEGRFEKDFYKTEDRYIENLNLIKEISTFNEPYKVLFGIGNNVFAEHISQGKSVRRMYHTDSAKLLYGVGILGLIVYISIYIGLIIKIFRIEGGTFIKDLRAGTLALIAISLIVSLNGSLNLITFRSINLLLIGAFMGMIKTAEKNNGSILPLQKGV